MSQWTKGVITNQGLELIAASQRGEPFAFTKIGMGEGLQSGTDQATLTALVQGVMTLPVLEEERVSTGIFRLRADMHQTDVPKSFYWREVGIFAKGADDVEVLYAYNYAGNNASFIPHIGLDTLTIQFSVAIGNTENVSAVLDESAAYLLKGKAEADYLKKADAAATYLPKTDATTTYATKTEAATLLKKTDAAATYLTKTDAANTYLKQSVYDADKMLVFSVSIAKASWVSGGAGKPYTITITEARILLGNYVYTVSPSPETVRISGEAGGVVMSTPTVAGKATFTVPEVPSGTVVMIIRREVV